jgi:hypothetical protein
MPPESSAFNPGLPQVFGWSGQLPIQHTVQQNQQVAGIHQGYMQAGFQNQASATQSINPF